MLVGGAMALRFRRIPVHLERFNGEFLKVLLKVSSVRDCH